MEKAGAPRSPVVLHIPHASLVVPDPVRKQFLVPDEVLERELLRLTDRYTDDLFQFDGEAASVIAAASRLVVDVERFEDDAHEPMSKRGMGAIY